MNNFEKNALAKWVMVACLAITPLSFAGDENVSAESQSGASAVVPSDSKDKESASKANQKVATKLSPEQWHRILELLDREYKKLYIGNISADEVNNAETLVALRNIEIDQSIQPLERLVSKFFAGINTSENTQNTALEGLIQANSSEERTEALNALLQTLVDNTSNPTEEAFFNAAELLNKARTALTILLMNLSAQNENSLMKHLDELSHAPIDPKVKPLLVKMLGLQRKGFSDQDISPTGILLDDKGGKLDGVQGYLKNRLGIIYDANNKDLTEKSKFAPKHRLSLVFDNKGIQLTERLDKNSEDKPKNKALSGFEHLGHHVDLILRLTSGDPKDHPNLSQKELDEHEEEKKLAAEALMEAAKENPSTIVAIWGQ